MVRMLRLPRGFGLMRRMTRDLPTQLGAALAAAPPGVLRVAYSGGPDSSALLHALSLLPAARMRDLQALHVDHGLHADSARWAAHCLAQCARWQVPITLLRVRVNARSGMGMEAAARGARYAALADRLPAGGLLVLAQHREDQAETVLLKLLRGAGPEGLGGMRELRAFAGGWLWRPLLEMPRSALRAHIEAHGLRVIDDPANRDPAHARSFLRQHILPQLGRHWPEASAALLHVARVQRALADDLAQRSAEALRTLLDAATQTLDVAAWLALPELLHAPVLARWLHPLGLDAPSSAQRAALQTMLREAAHDRNPQLRYAGSVLRAWRGRLYAEPWSPPPTGDWDLAWDGAPLALAGGASLCLDAAARFTPFLRVRACHVGERVRPAGAAHARDLGSLFQRANVPPWQRARCPLIETAAGEMLALGDIALSAAGQAYFSARGARPVWRRTAPLPPSQSMPTIESPLALR
jgi:tRNA(Ile)-lysidine synthase